MADSEIFQKFNEKEFSELLDSSFKTLSQKLSSKESFSHFKTICSKSGIEFSELEPSLQRLLQLCREAAKKNKSVAQLCDELSSLGLNEDQIDHFSTQWEKIRSSITQTTADTIPINPLIDMEWKFGVSSASSQCNTVGNVFLQIKLEVDEGNGRTKTVCFELQLSEFYSFLHEMERARASLDYLS